MPEPMVKIVLYAADPGARAQLERLRTWTRAHAIPITATLHDDDQDAGIRSGLLEALDYIRRRAAAVVAVTDLDVIAPGVIEQEAYRAEVARAGGRVHALGTPHDTPDNLRARLQEFERARLGWERAELVRRLHGGRARAAQDPEWFAGGRAPLGMEVAGGRLVESAAEMAVIGRMRVLRRGGASYERIAAILSAEMYVTKEGHTTWHREQVRRALMRHGDQPRPDVPGDASTEQGAPQ